MKKIANTLLFALITTVFIWLPIILGIAYSNSR